MGTAELLFMLIFCAGALILGIIGVENKNEWHRYQHHEKLKRKADRLITKWNRYFEPGTVINRDKCIEFSLIYNTVNIVNEHTAQENYSEVISILEPFFINYADRLHLLNAVHPEGTSFSLNLPRFNQRKVSIKSLLHEKTYSVTLSPYTCSCDEFKKFSHLPENDIRRCCRHIVKALHDTPLKKFFFHELDTYSKLILDEPYRSDFYCFLKEEELELLIGYSLPLDWVRIWVLKPKLIVDSFSFSLLENRWSYGESPKGFSLKSKKLLKQSFGI